MSLYIPHTASNFMVLSVMIIYTDGACKTNPGPGGFAFIVYENKQYHAYYGAASDTTNNRMELLGMLHALKYIQNSKTTTDSKPTLRQSSLHTTQSSNLDMHVNDISQSSEEAIDNNDINMEVESNSIHPHHIIYSDSKYVVQGITEWMENWHTRHWKTASKQDVKNPDLWQAIYQTYHALDNVQIKWIKAHIRSPQPHTDAWGNHLADLVASCSVTAHSPCDCSQYISTLSSVEQ